MNRIKLTIFCAFSSLFILTACKKDNGNTSGIDPNTVNNLVLQSDWEVTYFWEEDHEETEEFEGYTLDFTNDDKITATKDTAVVNGTWFVMEDDNKVKLVMDFAGHEVLDELTYDWDVIEHSDTTIQLKYQSTGDDHYDLLTLQKL